MNVTPLSAARRDKANFCFTFYWMISVSFLKILSNTHTHEVCVREKKVIQKTSACSVYTIS